MKSRILRPRPRPTPSTAFRLRLQDELARRGAANPHYSLRAFAADLRTDHATLSQLLRGRRRLSPRTIRLLGRRLGIAPEEVEEYVRHEPLVEAARPSPGGDARLRSLARAASAALTGWHHFAILELTRLETFRPDVRWIARQLDLEPDDVLRAVDGLVRLGLLRMTSPDRWDDLTRDLVFELDDFRREAVRRIDAELVALLPGDERLHEWSTTTLAVDATRLPEALARLNRFRAELVELLQRETEADDVYRLDISLFPLTRDPSHEENDHA